MNNPYDTSLEMVNEIIERANEGQKLRLEGKDGILTWTDKDTGEAFFWLNGYVKALEDNALITDEQSQYIRKKNTQPQWLGERQKCSLTYATLSPQAS